MKVVQERPLPEKRELPTRRLELTVSNLLRFGVLLSAAVVLAGGVFYLLRHGFQTPDFHQFAGDASPVRSLRSILAAAAALDPAGVIQLGVLLLIATPVVRVLYALMSFLREKDYKFVVITLIVAAVLLYGFLGGKA